MKGNSDMYPEYEDRYVHLENCACILAGPDGAPKVTTSSKDKITCPVCSVMASYSEAPKNG